MQSFSVHIGQGTAGGRQVPQAAGLAVPPQQHSKVTSRRSSAATHATGTTTRPAITATPGLRAPATTVDPNLATVSRGGVPGRLTVADLAQNDGGPPRFFSPWVAGRHHAVDPATLPLMIYLPGIDGTGLAASRQFPSIMRDFDLRAFLTPVQDRTPFDSLVDIIAKYLEEEVGQHPPERPVYLLGESFGCVLSLAVAVKRPELVDRLVLVNPATSFEQSVWSTIGPLLPSIPKDLWRGLPVALAPVLGNPLLLAGFGIDPKASITAQLTAARDGLLNLIPQLEALSVVLPPETLAWKLELLRDGSRKVNKKLKSVLQRVLLLTSDQDLLLPSRTEGPRLARALPRCNHKIFPANSHALLQEAGIDLVDIMKERGFFVTQRRMTSPLASRQKGSFGQAGPIELPTIRELDQTTEQTTDLLRRLTSPVFFSTHEDGRVVRGLDAVPDDRPILFVGNHQFYALDIGILIEEFLRQRDMLPRGLAHPVIFGGGAGPSNDEEAEQSAGFQSLLTTYGAVMVGGRNFFRLLKNKEAALLYPGGVREAYHKRGEEYKVLWPEREEFVRMAARFGATIVPVSGVGCNDCVQLIADSDELRRIPVLGQRLEAQSKRQMPPARRGTAMTAGFEEETLIAPFSLPKLPARFYFKFQAPIRTSREDLKDRARCDQIYARARDEVQGGIDWLLEQRLKDPYKDLGPRLFYEATWNGKQAPTFPLPPTPPAGWTPLPPRKSAPSESSSTSADTHSARSPAGSEDSSTVSGNGVVSVETSTPAGSSPQAAMHEATASLEGSTSRPQSQDGSGAAGTEEFFSNGSTIRDGNGVGQPSDGVRQQVSQKEIQRPAPAPASTDHARSA